MRQYILSLTFLLLSFKFYAQIPAPCGISPIYKCDENNDGIEVFDLMSGFPFSTFCTLPNTELEEDYHPIYYYVTLEDMNNQTNPIANPSMFVGTTNPQIIYYRANAINSGGNFEFLSQSENFIEAIERPTPNKESTMEFCDNDGFRIFNLNNSEVDILAGLRQNYFSIDYYESLTNAVTELNKIENTSEYSNLANPQQLYARVYPFRSRGCYEIVLLNLSLITEAVVCEDIAVFLIPQSRPRPGFTHKYKLVIRNLSEESAVSGRVQFNNDEVLDLIGITGVDIGDVVTNFSNGFYFDFVDLAPNLKKNILIELKTPVDVMLGTKLNTVVEYLDTDININNNISLLSQTVIGSYDPNDISESHGPEILHSSFTSNDYLYYTIRFQNVGTADAINVSIDNTLNSDLDESTIQILSSSHTNIFTRIGNQLNWQFDNIHLPSESMDEPNSHGYIYYKIKPKVGYEVGDIIPNTAEIYFDFNPAVITNTFNTEFVTSLSIEEIYNNQISIFPNPTNGSPIQLKFDNKINESIQIGVYNIQGKEIIIKDFSDNDSLQLNVEQLSKGIYFLKITSRSYKIVKKLVIN